MKYFPAFFSLRHIYFFSRPVSGMHRRFLAAGFVDCMDPHIEIPVPEAFF